MVLEAVSLIREGPMAAYYAKNFGAPGHDLKPIPGSSPSDQGLPLRSMPSPVIAIWGQAYNTGTLGAKQIQTTARLHSSEDPRFSKCLLS